MQEKAIHIVFQVMNYVFAPVSQDHRLLPVHRLLLIALAKHHGVKGIYPSTTTLAKELNVSSRYIKTCLNYLESLHILKIERKNGRSNHYYLEFLSTDQGTTDHRCTTDHRGTTDHPTGELQIRNRGSTDHPISINNQLRRNNTERRKKTAHPLSDDFEPSEETAVKAKALGLKREECEVEFEKFMNYYLENGVKKINWQLTLQNWFIKGAEWKKAHPAKPKPEEVRSTVPWYKPEDGERGAAPIGKLLNGLATKAREHLDKQGGKPNGLGNQGQGEKTKD